MAKIMLVEDDKNLSSIYRDRLLAEGYEIVEAHDGEEALALAVKEKPTLIISDVMMPKISGFDMLDILRSTPETKNTKVIMMTALSQAEDQQRATKLGADKYLVKSQVTLDDVARVVKEVLGGDDSSMAMSANTPEIQTPVTDNSTVVTSAPLPTKESTSAPEPQLAQAAALNASADTAAASLPAESVVEEKKEIETEIENFAQSLPTEPPLEVNTVQPQATIGERIVQPPSESANKPDIMALYEKEMAQESTQTADPQPTESPENTDEQSTDPHNIAL